MGPHLKTGFMPSRRLLLAVALSLLLHATVIGLPGIDFLRRPDRTGMPLEARLLPVPLTTAQDPDEALLKDTLAEELPERIPAAPSLDVVSRDPQSTAADAAASAAIDQVRRKPGERRFYPPQAAAQGIEGEVRLRLTLDAEGRLVDVQIAASSGHAELDQAALRAAGALGSLPGIGMRELILPVVFRLQ